jgi:hypothetical protein
MISYTIDRLDVYPYFENCQDHLALLARCPKFTTYNMYVGKLNSHPDFDVPHGTLPRNALPAPSLAAAIRAKRGDPRLKLMALWTDSDIIAF